MLDAVTEVVWTLVGVAVLVVGFLRLRLVWAIQAEFRTRGENSRIGEVLRVHAREAKVPVVGGALAVLVGFLALSVPDDGDPPTVEGALVRIALIVILGALGLSAALELRENKR